MKEATGEVSMTVIVIVAVAIIGGIIVALGPKLKETIETKWGNSDAAACKSGGGKWHDNKDGTGYCKMPQKIQ